MKLLSKRILAGFCAVMLTAGSGAQQLVYASPQVVDIDLSEEALTDTTEDGTGDGTVSGEIVGTEDAGTSGEGAADTVAPKEETNISTGDADEEEESVIVTDDAEDADNQDETQTAAISWYGYWGDWESDPPYTKASVSEIIAGNTTLAENQGVWAIYDSGELVICGNGDIKTDSEKVIGHRNCNCGFKLEIHEYGLSDYDKELYKKHVMAEGCFRYSDSSLNTPSLTPWGTWADVTNATIHLSGASDLSYMFYGFSALQSIDDTNFDTSSAENMAYMFYRCPALESLDLSKFKTDSVTDMSYMFYCCTALADLEVGSFNTANVANMTEMFSGCSSLTNLDVSSFDLSAASDMTEMFFGCSSLASLTLPVPGSAVSSGLENRNMTKMFYGCSSLESLDVSGLDTAGAANMSYMFADCSALTSLTGLSSAAGQTMFDTSTVTDMSYMFAGCSALTELDLSIFNTEYLTDISYMFSDCTSLTSLDLSSFDMNKVAAVPAVFTNDNELLTIKTPKNVRMEVGLPSSRGTCWFRENGEEIDVLPQGLSESETICRKTSTGGEASGEDTTQVTISGISAPDAVYSGLAYVYQGTAVVKDADGANVSGEVALSFQYSGTTADGENYGPSAQAPANVGNYTLSVTVEENAQGYTGSADYSFAITPAALTITVRNITICVNQTPDYKYEVTGLLNGDTLITEPTFQCDADMSIEGRYAIEAAGADAGSNYTIMYKSGTLTVAQEQIAYCVSFDLQGHGTQKTYEDYVVKAGSTIKEPEAPTENGCIFFGWYRDASCSKAWDFATDTVQEDLTLYAGWAVSAMAPNSEAEVGFRVQEIGDIYYYTGSAVKPTVRVYKADADGSGQTLLKSGTDYSIKYYNNINASVEEGGVKYSSTAVANDFNPELPYVVITGKGNYSGSIYMNFKIFPASIGDGNKDLADGFSLKYTEQLTVNNKAQETISSLKYKKTLKKNTDFTAKLTDAEGKTVSESSSLPKNASGHFTLVIEGRGNYSGTIEKSIYAADKSFLMKNAKITIGKSVKSQPYNHGQPVTLTPSDEKGAEVFTVELGKMLTYGTDYTVEYENNTAVGTATLTVVGMGSYVGSKSATFKITGNPFTSKKVVVTGLEERKYTGSAITQNDVKLEYITEEGKIALTYGTDYKILYKNNVNKGKATVTFEALPSSGYSGKFSKTFQITAADLKASMRQGEETVSVPYTPLGAKPELTLVDENGNTLKAGTDYTLKYSNNKAVGSKYDVKPPTITVTGKKNYRGNFQVTFTITQRDLSDSEISASPSAVVYNAGKGEKYEYTPSVKLLFGKKTISSGEYKISGYSNHSNEDIAAYLEYLDNGSAGEAPPLPTMTITAAGKNYTGEKKDIPLSVYRTKLTAKNLEITVTGETIFTGGQLTPEITVTYKGEENIVLKEGVDYTLVYGENIKVGKNKGSVTVVGIAPAYGGSVTKKFTIESRPIFSDSVTVYEGN